MARIVIDPVTRAGGHLRVEVEVAGGVVTDAWSSGTMFRGLETILPGRDPRAAWLLAQRICGACNGAHALASVRAVEAALDVTIPRNARLLRNVLAGSQFVLDHVVAFYHRQAVDWVDVVTALSADPAAASVFARSLSGWPRSSTEYFVGVRDRLAGVVGPGRAGPFANPYWGHPAYTLPPETGLVVLAHYLEAFDLQRTVIRLQTLLGGKTPHPQSFLVGGMALAPSWGGPVPPPTREHPVQVERDSPAALSDDGLQLMADLIGQIKDFVDQVYVPDVLAVAGRYPDWTRIGAGIGNYLSFGEFPESDLPEPDLLLPRGRIMGRDLAATEPVEQAGIAETVAHSYYTYDGDDTALRHPFEGQTEPEYLGPPPPVTTLAGSDRYSWLKAPRYTGERMEVGPLARVLVASTEGQRDVRVAIAEILGKLDLTPDALSSTLGRTIARAIEARVIAARLRGWLEELSGNLATGDLAVADITKWDPEAWPNEARGWALGEAPRGALGHWLGISGGLVSDYQVVDASTWNASPRDAAGNRGALEEALIGTPVVDPDRPVEILRTVHSFDPCTACAVHLHRPAGGNPLEIRIVRGGAR